MEVNGIRFWCYTAGHVLGAAMFMVDIAGMRVLYTGDYSCEEDRHLRAAEMPHFSPDVCIIESTYGVQIHQPRIMRERRFTDTVAQTVSQVKHTTPFFFPFFSSTLDRLFGLRQGPYLRGMIIVCSILHLN